MKKGVVFLLLIFACFPTSRVFATNGVEINTASLQQLETLIGIKSVKAQAIIDARPFSSVDDLIRVKGIGTKVLQKIKDQGLAYVEGQNQQLAPVEEINRAPEPTPTLSPTSTPTPTPDSITNNQNSNNQSAISTPTPSPEPTFSPTPEPTPTATPIPTPSPTPTPIPASPKISYPGGITFSEILPWPATQESENEWVEISNANNFSVSLAGWKMKDQKGATKTYTFPKNSEIKTQGYLIVARPESKITLNNDGDGLVLFDPAGKTIDSISYEKAFKGASFAKIQGKWVWTNGLTPGAENKFPSELLVADASGDSSLQGNSVNQIAGAETAAVANAANPGNNNPDLKTKTLAIFLAAFLSVGILVLNKEVKKLKTPEF